MHSAILVHPDFDHIWPWSADHLGELWCPAGPLEFRRLALSDRTAAHQALPAPERITRLACLGVPFTLASLAAMPALRELAAAVPANDPLRAALAERGVRLIWQQDEGFWGQSVSEFALGLTLGALRRIPQTHHRIQSDLQDWHYAQPDGHGRPGGRGQQYGDDTRFTNGTLAGKRVRIVGAGNIGSRYADFCAYLGAEVAIWDPFASGPCFHRAGARREFFLERLVCDAEIFAPMLPLTPATSGVVKAEHLRALPKGCLVVTVTRARICDCAVLYERVLANELALAADVFADEPLPLGHALLGRDNVVHTPHNAGRTRQANEQFAAMLAAQFQLV